MLKNYLKIAYRNIIRYKSFSFINVTGLAIGLAASIIIFMWVQDELSFDKFHNNSDRIYRLNKKYMMNGETSFNPSTPFPLAQTVKEKYAEVEEATHYFRQTIMVKYDDQTFRESRAVYTDPAFFNIFSFKFSKKNFKQPLAAPNTVIITEKTAQKYFGSRDVLGKTLLINQRQEYTISGILENIPDNSSINYDLFLSCPERIKMENADDWGNHWLRTFVLLKENAALDQVQNKIASLLKEHLPEEDISLAMQPLNKLHLYSVEGKPEGMKFVYFFSLIAAFILIIACINFMNLSTARSSKRAREVGLRKVVGASKSQLIRQFFGESLLVSFIALFFAIILIELITPAFNELTGKSLSVNYLNLQILPTLLTLAVVTGLLSGSYPSFFLASFRTVNVLKGDVTGKGRSKSGLRKTLVVIQFSLAIMLMAATGIIYSQLQYIQNKDMGYQKENIIYLSLNPLLRGKYDAFKSELLPHHDIESITRTSEVPTEIWSIMRGITWEGKETDEGAAFGFAAVDYDYFETLGMEMVQGRPFSKEFPTDTANFIFNEKAIKMMGFENPIGKPFALDESSRGTIVGVVKDFHSLPLTYEIEPMMLLIYPEYYRNILIKVSTNDMQQTIEKIETAYAGFCPGIPFNYRFLDQEFDYLYKDEIRSGKLFSYFVILAIFISCLGLLGLASFTTEQRTKEIGVRKVHGASIAQIVFILSKDFAKWVLLANVIAWPAAWLAMNKWLQNFVYKIEIGPLIFVLAGGLALLIALLTISSQAIKAAKANPIEALKYE